MKSTMQKKNGVHRDQIDNWIVQYTFKMRFIMGNNISEFAEFYKKI